MRQRNLPYLGVPVAQKGNKLKKIRYIWLLLDDSFTDLAKLNVHFLVKLTM